MITTVSISEILKLVNWEHKEPHSVLGIHSINGGRELAVRAFIPGAEEITLFGRDGKLSVALEKTHSDGFFEALIPDKTEWFPYYFRIKNITGGTWESGDPYSYPPTVSEYDRYLFCRGTNYRIFDKLGAHLMDTRDGSGAAFAVWAPNALALSVVGDFNGWDCRRHPMRLLPDCGIWELFIPGLAEGDKYKFEIKTPAGEHMLKTDPYGNFFEHRPDNAAVLYNINGYDWNDVKWMEGRGPIDDKPLNIYEVHLGSWARKPEEGNRPLSYIELARTLVPYAVDMGYTHIELLPVMEYPYDGSWGYQVTGYFAPTSRYGTPKEFMKFVDICHQSNLGVILDWVPAHFPKDGHGLGRFDGTPLYESADPRLGEHMHWGTYIFDYGRPEVKNFLIASALFWVEKYHADGLRVDAVASMLYLDYGREEGCWVPNCRGGRENLAAEELFKHLNSVMDKTYSNILMIAEESTSWPGVTRPAEEGGLGFTLKWNMGWMNDFLSFVKKDHVYRKFHHELVTFSMMYAYSERFVLVLSHDEVVHMKASMINKMPGDPWQKFAGLRAAYGFMAGHPGKKLLFMGSEFGQYSEWSEERSLDWHLLENDENRKLREFVRDLNRLYASEPAFWELDNDPWGFEWIECGDERSVFAFIRRSRAAGQELIFVVNFTPAAYFDYRLGLPIPGCYTEIITSDSEKYGGSGVINRGDIKSGHIECQGRPFSLELRVPPLGCLVLKRKPGNAQE